VWKSLVICVVYEIVGIDIVAAGIADRDAVAVVGSSVAGNVVVAGIVEVDAEEVVDVAGIVVCTGVGV